MSESNESAQPTSESFDSGPNLIPESELQGSNVLAESSEQPETDAIALTGTQPETTTEQSPRAKRTKRKRVNLSLVFLFVALLLGWAFYAFAWPRMESSIRQWLQPNRARYDTTMSFPVRELYHTCEYLAVLWFFYFGASIGSFFNVLAWRLPRGQGVVFGGSKCPYCANRLSFRDNMPVVGWLSCKGRCTSCSLPISPRYLIMEVVVGSVFVLIAFRELFSGGANLPDFSLLWNAGIIGTVFYPKWNLIAAYAFHAMFLATLVLLAAADMEKAKFPWRAISLFGAIFGVIKVIQPDLQFVRWFNMVLVTPPTWPAWVHACLTLAAGIAIGMIIGLATRLAMPASVNEKARTHWQQSLLMVGIVLGWQAVVLISLVALPLIWFTSALAKRDAKDSSIWFFSILITAVLVHHVFWRQIVSMIGGRLAM